MGISDWSSDVCSSDLAADVIGLPRALFLVLAEAERILRRRTLGRAIHHARLCAADVEKNQLECPADGGVGARALPEAVAGAVEIGRASCRERVCQYV